MIKRIIFFLAIIVIMFFGYRFIDEKGSNELLSTIKGRVIPREDDSKEKVVINIDDSNLNDKKINISNSGQDSEIENKDTGKESVKNITNIKESEKLIRDYDNIKPTGGNKENYNNTIKDKNKIVVINNDEEILDWFSNNIE